jgi:hypothetical protein
MPLRALPRVVDDGDRAGIGLGVVQERVEPDLVSVRVVQLGQDPSRCWPSARRRAVVGDTEPVDVLGRDWRR